MLDGGKPEHRGWNRISLEVSDLADTVGVLHKEGVHVRHDVAVPEWPLWLVDSPIWVLHHLYVNGVRVWSGLWLFSQRKQVGLSIITSFLGERIDERSKRFWRNYARNFENDSSTKKYGEF
jgi:hypothetical protein